MGKPLRLDTKQNRETHSSFTSLGTGQVTFAAQRRCVGKKMSVVCALVLAAVPSRGLEKKTTLTFQRHFILDAQRQ